ncbi:MAG: hypothetical protein IKN54_04055, partial [Lachnospiraceae bacterium]|nr:hypothetical protein [Lachnospiraceae bacterium]
MLSTILLILKIIGIILAVLIGMVLLLLLIPFKYVGKGDFKESKKAGLSLIWLLFVIRGGVFYEDGDLRIRVRFLGIPLYSKKIIDKDGTDKSKKDLNTGDTFRNHKGDIKSKNKQNDNIVKKDVVETLNDDINISDESMKDSSGSEESNSGLSGKIKNIKILIKKLNKKFKEAKRLIKSKGCKMAVASTKLTAVKLLKHLKPNKIESEMTFGFDTPDKTGQV